MLRLFDHECRLCGLVFEELVEPEAPKGPPCPKCDAVDAKRLITGTRIDPRLGIDPSGFPTMGDKWAKIRRQRQQIERKRDSEDR